MDILVTHHVVNSQPDCLAWCPAKGKTDRLIAATYDLPEGQDAKNNKRSGGLRLYKFVNENNLDTRIGHDLKLLDSLDCGGVFEVHFLKGAGSAPRFCAALTDGRLLLGVIAENGDTLKQLFTVSCCEGAMLTTVDSCGFGHSTSYICGDSAGNLTHVTSAEESGDGMGKRASWCAHQLPYSADSAEVWSVGWSYVDGGANSVVSGGDDCLLKMWDVRLKNDQPVAVNRCHSGGVTCILTEPDRPHDIITGSYDESIRLLDVRNLKREVSQLNVGGGVWKCARVQFPSSANISSTKSLLGVACMYAGYCFIDLNEPEIANNDSINWTLRSKHQISEGSLVYGFDWRNASRCEVLPDQKLLGESIDNIFGVCSFYDKTIQIGRLTLK